jgi:hypothetical protein
MGAKGSTRWNGYTPLATVESCIALKASELAAAIEKASNQVKQLRLSAPSAGETLTITFCASVSWPLPALTKFYKVFIQWPFQQGIELESLASLGGPRWFLRCPHRVSGTRFCYKRVGALYQLPGSDGFACRHCLNLTYSSTRKKQNLAEKQPDRPSIYLNHRALRAKSGVSAKSVAQFSAKPI